MKIAYITAGAAGMYCGNCLRDHALASAFHSIGEEVLLVPIYTPLLTDIEPGVELKDGPIFFNGVRAYLEQHVPYLRRPRPILDGVLGSRPVEKLLASLPMGTDASRLGPLTHSMLRGEEGNQGKEIEKILDWLRDEYRPDIVHISNVLLVGMARRFKEELGVPIVCGLQSEANFIAELEQPYRTDCIEEIRQRASEVDGLLAVSTSYRAIACEMIGVEEDKVSVVLPGIPLEGHSSTAAAQDGDELSIGYFARICPEKGLDKLCQAFTALAIEREGGMRLKAAGYLPKSSTSWLSQVSAGIKKAGLAEKAELVGTLNREEKLEFLSQLDIFSVPAQRPESKGLYALEAMASGVPVVLPAEGVFPELLGKGGGGILYDPADEDGLRNSLGMLVDDSELRRRLGDEGRGATREFFNSDRMAMETLEFYRTFT